MNNAASQNGYNLLVLMLNNDMHIRKFPRFQYRDQT